ncbi:unnamed protein product [Brassica rapa]|uniref:Uncharacterized protein n=1 Tax=Brassica campestris TaxID=3711 RepID=A0A3P5ZI54_BRACM|nr:unnamed protein product [Brassica rapa]VDC77849.1 unnamed protein product [Brassica rapa]
MARENSCLSRIAAVGGALGGVVGDVFGTYEATIFKVPGVGAGLMKLRY